MPQRALPPVQNANDDTTKNQQIALTENVRLPSTPIAPWNFQAKNQRGGMLLSWAALIPTVGSTPAPASTPKADGYELQRSDTGDFSVGKYISIPIRDPAQTSYFDSLGGAALTKYYRLRATNGTGSTPYVVHGIFTGVVKHTSIDASDVATVPTSIYDNFTTDKTQARARAWKSGTQYPNQR